MALDPLAELSDLAVRIPLTLDDRLERAEALMRDASATVRSYTGQEFTEGTSTLQLMRPKNGVVRLPQRPVTAVDAVEDVNGNDVSFTWIGDDRVRIAGNVIDSFAFEPWRYGITSVKVTYDHGYTEIPDDIIAIVCQIAARALGRSPEESGTQQESIAGYSYTVGSVGAAGAVGMLPEEKRVLDGYAFPLLGSIPVGL